MQSNRLTLPLQKHKGIKALCLAAAALFMSSTATYAAASTSTTELTTICPTISDRASESATIRNYAEKGNGLACTYVVNQTKAKDTGEATADTLESGPAGLLHVTPTISDEWKPQGEALVCDLTQKKCEVVVHKDNDTAAIALSRFDFQTVGTCPSFYPRLSTEFVEIRGDQVNGNSLVCNYLEPKSFIMDAGEARANTLSSGPVARLKITPTVQGEWELQGNKQVCDLKTKLCHVSVRSDNNAEVRLTAYDFKTIGSAVDGFTYKLTKLDKDLQALKIKADEANNDSSKLLRLYVGDYMNLETSKYTLVQELDNHINNLTTEIAVLKSRGEPFEAAQKRLDVRNAQKVAFNAAGGFISNLKAMKDRLLVRNSDWPIINPIIDPLPDLCTSFPEFCDPGRALPPDYWRPSYPYPGYPHPGYPKPSYPDLSKKL